MTTADILATLEKVRKSGSGWIAICPAHRDRTPSLSIREGERGVLLRCWSGCRLEEICNSLGITVSDLFFDAAADPMIWRKRKAESQNRRRIEASVRTAELERPSVFREAESVIRAAGGISISKWDADRLHLALNIVSEAHKILITERDHYGLI